MAASSHDSTRTNSSRLALRESTDARSPGSVDGAWWPLTRSLAGELPRFFDAWPARLGRIHRILYSPPDWDDHPRSVAVADRRVKTGSFPRDDTHRIVVTLADRSSLVITVIDPDTSAAEAADLMNGLVDIERQPSVDYSYWENEGGRI